MFGHTECKAPTSHLSGQQTVGHTDPTLREVWARGANLSVMDIEIVFLRHGWDCLAKGQCAGWEEGRGPRTTPEGLLHWSLSKRREELATEPINKNLGTVLKPKTVSISMFLKVETMRLEECVFGGCAG